MLTRLCFAGLIVAAMAKRCANTPPSPEARARASLRTSRFRAMNETAAPAVIPTFVHVVAFNETVEGGWVSDEDIKAQMDVMQADYAPHDISFELKNISRTINADWAQEKDVDNMRRELYTGGHDTLNLFIQTEFPDFFGYCTIPSDHPPNSSDFYLDGCAILSSTLPNGAFEGFNLGKTATHEVGHWLGLMHTFEGGCSAEGDGIADTPASLEPSEGCPTNRDSCPDMPGMDPIHNYMDYSDDSCMTEFTKNQEEHMHAGWQMRVDNAAKARRAANVRFRSARR